MLLLEVPALWPKMLPLLLGAPLVVWSKMLPLDDCPPKMLLPVLCPAAGGIVDAAAGVESPAPNNPPLEAAVPAVGPEPEEAVLLPKIEVPPLAKMLAAAVEADPLPAPNEKIELPPDASELVVPLVAVPREPKMLPEEVDPALAFETTVSPRPPKMLPEDASVALVLADGVPKTKREPPPVLSAAGLPPAAAAGSAAADPLLAGALPPKLKMEGPVDDESLTVVAAEEVEALAPKMLLLLVVPAPKMLPPELCPKILPAEPPEPPDAELLAPKLKMLEPPDEASVEAEKRPPEPKRPPLLPPTPLLPVAPKMLEAEELLPELAAAPKLKSPPAEALLGALLLGFSSPGS
mmetsp:Transcript_106593/g.200780  ORF Transcript_106593/g.200780 Transcript_106593/m.200780 type:complete len:350 (-) Transcript_106593:662-1711(-)